MAGRRDRDGHHGLLWEKADTTELGYGDVTADHRSAHMTDLYLIPGEHWLRVDGSDGDYALTLTPLGPPDPNGEREPNNQSINAEPLRDRSDSHRPPAEPPGRGRLPVDGGHRGPPADHGDAARRRLHQHAPRERLPAGRRHPGRTRACPASTTSCSSPGDYDLWLIPDAASQGKYCAERGTRGPVPAGRRTRSPTTTSSQARPLPASLHIEGDSPTSGDTGLVRARRAARSAAT